MPLVQPGAEATRDVSEKGNKTNKLGRRFLSTRRLLAERGLAFPAWLMPCALDVRVRSGGGSCVCLRRCPPTSLLERTTLTPAAFENGSLSSPIRQRLREPAGAAGRSLILPFVLRTVASRDPSTKPSLLSSHTRDAAVSRVGGMRRNRRAVLRALSTCLRVSRRVSAALARHVDCSAGRVRKNVA